MRRGWGEEVDGYDCLVTLHAKISLITWCIINGTSDSSVHFLHLVL